MNIVEIDGHKINLDVMIGIPFHTERINTPEGGEQDIIVFSKVETLPEDYSDADVGKAKAKALIEIYKILKMTFVEDKNEN